MERTPTFALPNEFLIWVAAKFLANYDLNLLLTEYYKEKLESQLKNGNIQTYPYITSAKLTNISRLNLSTDPKTYNKPSDLRPFFCTLLTPPFSPIPTPITLSNSLSISCPCLSSHFFPLFQLSPDVKTFDIAKDISISARTMFESSMENTDGSISMLSNPNFSKESMPASIPVYSHMVMPYPGTPKTPFFEGSNVTNFLDRHCQMCTDYRVDKQEKMKRLLWYCGMFTKKYIETFISSSGTFWTALRKVLREKYKD